jgi:hypothetical protein
LREDSAVDAVDAVVAGLAERVPTGLPSESASTILEPRGRGVPRERLGSLGRADGVSSGEGFSGAPERWLMGVFIIFVAPLLLGFGLIFVIARFSPNVPRTAALRAGQRADERPEITADEFADVIKDLLEALGLETVFSSAGTGGVVDVTARDPRPLTGGRILLHATPVLAGQVDAVDVLAFAEGVRGDMGALKGIYIALAGFTEEAHAGVRSSPAPVDLVDGGRLLDLVREHLPERADLLVGYRGFDVARRRHAREGREAHQT